MKFWFLALLKKAQGCCACEGTAVLEMSIQVLGVNVPLELLCAFGLHSPCPSIKLYPLPLPLLSCFPNSSPALCGYITRRNPSKFRPFSCLQLLRGLCPMWGPCRVLFWYFSGFKCLMLVFFQFQLLLWIRVSVWEDQPWACSMTRLSITQGTARPRSCACI